MKKITLGEKKEEKNTKDLHRGNKQKEMFFIQSVENTTHFLFLRDAGRNG